MRSLQLVHYRVNELGDIQTEPPRHAEWPSLAEVLAARGYARADLGLLLGGNYRRIFAAVAGGDRTG